MRWIAAILILAGCQAGSGYTPTNWGKGTEYRISCEKGFALRCENNLPCECREILGERTQQPIQERIGK